MAQKASQVDTVKQLLQRSQAPTMQFECWDTPPSLTTTEMFVSSLTLHGQPHLSHEGLFSASRKFACWKDIQTLKHRF